MTQISYLFAFLVASFLQAIFIVLKLVDVAPISEWNWFAIFLPAFFLILSRTQIGYVVVTSKIWWIVVGITTLCYLSYII